MLNVTDRGWRIEVRTAPDPRVPVPAGGRLLGFAHQLDDGRWRVGTTDGRTVTLDTRVAAVLSLLAMTDATDPEPGTVAELQREADRLAIELGRTVARLAAARATVPEVAPGREVYERPADPGAGARHGARFGGVLDSGDLVHDDPAAGS